MHHLDLSSNLLDPPCADPLRRMLTLNRTLRGLSVACNALEDAGAKILAEGVKANGTLQKLDVRLTGILYFPSYLFPSFNRD